MLKLDFVTLFPTMIEQAMSQSMMGRAQADEIIRVRALSQREFTQDVHKKIDDISYGGGPGMVMMAPFIHQAVQSLIEEENRAIILTDPAGEKFTQEHAIELKNQDQIIFICGHYGGVDERVRTKIATHTFTIGDYVLTGGELPALVMADSMVRLLPGVLGNEESPEQDSFQKGLLGYPVYTKPREFLGEEVPEVLLSGHHEKIREWREQMQIERTKLYRPDLLDSLNNHP